MTESSAAAEVKHTMAESEDVLAAPTFTALLFLKNATVHRVMSKPSLQPSDDPDGTFPVDNDDMGTCFSASEASNGVFTTVNGDLYFIKKNGTRPQASLNKEGKYSKVYEHFQTAFPPEQIREDNGRLTGQNGDVYYISNQITRTTFVIQESAKKTLGYRPRYVTQTPWGLDGVQDAVWDIGARGLTYFIKTKSTTSGRIEVHVSWFLDVQPQQIHHCVTAFEASDADN
ncbi:MAG: hypothetical protein Q9166_003269 [cf. Caloplaca sp. 2 TL-2023]